MISNNINGQCVWSSHCWLLMVTLYIGFSSLHAAAVPSHLMPLKFDDSSKLSPDETPNFLLSKTLQDGEQATWVHWRGRWARELKYSSNNPGADHLGMLRLVQVTNGQVLVHNIYDSVDGNLIDCDVIRETHKVTAFIEEFQSETVPLLREIDVQNATKFQYLELRDARDQPLLQYGTIKHECRLHHHQSSNHSGHSSTNKRTKRSLLISPGTQWCGSGSTAQHAYDLGHNAPVDMCCREHDGCPYVIEGFTTRFGYFNYRFYTMSFCDCDRRFYECLKSQNTAQANMIGKLFFNVVSTSCFELKRDKMCTKYSFWGTCNQWRSGLQAKVIESEQY